jgi:hypothetical protein
MKNFLKCFDSTDSSSLLSFYGNSSSNETIYSLLLESIERTKKIKNEEQSKLNKNEIIDYEINEKDLIVEESFHTTPEIINKSSLRKLNFRLLEIGITESILFQKDIIPKDYIKEYIEKQEHFSLINFLKSYLKQFYDEKNRIVCEKKKFVLFTRNTEEIINFTSEKKTQLLSLLTNNINVLDLELRKILFYVFKKINIFKIINR